ncbi:hypothetical protein [Bacillus cereus group sp. BfR-BA-01349]|uniref:hypothetical protein n=1 Tax=Bacillus cereus group sp. BfR-BA-01349 TaxID=2920312 RepID=UPI001F5706F4
MQKVVLGMKYEPFYKFFQDHFQGDFDICETNINKFEDVSIYVAQYNPEVLIFAEQFLEFEDEDNKDEKIFELINSISKNVRVCYMCIRNIDDPFFDQLKDVGITDIFYTPEIDMNRIKQQLKNVQIKIMLYFMVLQNQLIRIKVYII